MNHIYLSLVTGESGESAGAGLYHDSMNHVALLSITMHA